jgi:hypothetical protein
MRSNKLLTELVEKKTVGVCSANANNLLTQTQRTLKVSSKCYDFSVCSA